MHASIADAKLEGGAERPRRLDEDATARAKLLRHAKQQQARVEEPPRACAEREFIEDVEVIACGMPRHAHIYTNR